MSPAAPCCHYRQLIHQPQDDILTPSRRFHVPAYTRAVGTVSHIALFLACVYSGCRSRTHFAPMLRATPRSRHGLHTHPHQKSESFHLSTLVVKLSSHLASICVLVALTPLHTFSPFSGKIDPNLPCEAVRPMAVGFPWH